MALDESVQRMIADLENLGGLGSDDKNLDNSSLPESVRQKVLTQIEAARPCVVTDASGRILEINPAFSGLCGFSFSEIVGRTPGSFLQGKDTEEASVEVLRWAIREGAACEVEIYNYHKDGTRYRVRIQVVPLRDASGHLTGFRATETKLR